ncbi:MAG: Cof-type HAD-IIB family hydrolase [Endozoicomonas sp. (ex Botrylloides leachii)]|nr:Cof-type HAD-IIB family hydrolase [Endozoicomonas sp. (ex Botrylloides leachii)]
MYPVVVSDLDGTLFNDNHQISARTRQVIQCLSKQGVTFIFATGRHYLDISYIKAQLGIDTYLITSNGARVHDPKGKPIISHDIAPDYMSQLIEVGRKYRHQTIMNIYQNTSWFVEQNADVMLSYHKESGFNYVRKPLDQVSVTGTQKLFFNAETEEKLEPLANEIGMLFGEQLSLTYSLPTCFEVMNHGVSKAVALTEVLRLEGFSGDQAIVFGDGMNDFDMLKLAGKGVVMGGASDRLRMLLSEHEVIGLANDNAVAEYLAELYRLDPDLAS